MMDLLDEVAQHRFGDLKISDHAIFHGPNGHDIPWGASQHPFGFFAYGQDVGGPRLNRDDRGLPQDNPPIPHVNDGICRSEVYPNVIGKQALKLRKHEFCLTSQETKRNAAVRSRVLRDLYLAHRTPLFILVNAKKHETWRESAPTSAQNRHRATTGRVSLSGPGHKFC